MSPLFGDIFAGYAGMISVRFRGGSRK